MKKIIVSIVAVSLLLGGSAVAYFYFFAEAESGSTDFVSKWDTLNQIEPVEFSMRNQTFVLPVQSATSTLEATTTPQTVTLNLVSPGNVRDYPMGQLTTTEGERVTLTALDDFLSEEVAGKRALLLRKESEIGGEEYFLGIITITGETVEHLNSLRISDHIRPRSLQTDGSTVVFNYDVHDRDQDFTETPRINTSATIDLAEERVIIAGRYPKTEAVIRYKNFSGTYTWLYTDTNEDERIEPIDPTAFTMRFNANRVELTTDCNSGSSVFKTEPLPATTFTIESISTTSMFCESEQEDEYFAMIESITSYEEAEDGMLTFQLANNQTMSFVPKGRELEFGS